MTSVFILAGEASGDTLGAEAMAGIRQHYGRHIEFFGIGGQAMQAAGLENLAAMDTLTIMGPAEAVLNLRALYRLADKLIDEIAIRKPKLVLTIDSKGFSLRLLKRLRRRYVAAVWLPPLVHMVAPTVWAWGSWRAKAMRGVTDRLLCLFAFEQPFFNSHGVETAFVGHPAAWRKPPDKATANQLEEQLQQVLPAATGPLLALLPGSRPGEIARLLPPMLATAGLLQSRLPSLRLVLPTAPTVAAEVSSVLKKTALPVLMTETAALRDAVLARADAALMTSGTITLEAALAGLPGVAIYRSNPLSATIGRYLVRMDRVILPNVVLGRQIYPFLFQKQVKPAAMANLLEPLLQGGRAGAEVSQEKSLFQAKLKTADGSFAGSVASALEGLMEKP